MIPVLTARSICNSASSETPDVVCCVSAGIQEGGSWKQTLGYLLHITERARTLVRDTVGTVFSFSSRIMANEMSSVIQVSKKSQKLKIGEHAPPSSSCPRTASIILILRRKERKYCARPPGVIAFSTLKFYEVDFQVGSRTRRPCVFVEWFNFDHMLDRK